MLFGKWLIFDQMSRVGSRGRHPKCRPKNDRLELKCLCSSVVLKNSIIVLFADCEKKIAKSFLR